MATQSIQRDQWNSFFDGFSKDYMGRSGSLELVGSTVGDQVVAEGQIFRGISADLKDGENRIILQMSPSTDDGTTHSIIAPTAVWFKEGTDQEETSLEIRSADGGALILRFAQPSLLA